LNSGVKQLLPCYLTGVLEKNERQKFLYATIAIMANQSVFPLFSNCSLSVVVKNKKDRQE